MRTAIWVALVAVAQWQRIPAPDPAVVAITIVSLLLVIAQDIKEIIRK